jgi:hypothetical protein
VSNLTEAEELELLELEAEAAQAEAPAPKPEDGVLSRGVKWIGRQASRLPAAIRGGVQAIQGGDPRTAATSRNPIVMAGRGFMDPESVQSPAQMMANAGVSTEPKMQVRAPTVDDQIMAHAKGLPPPIADTTYTTPAEEIGTAVDLMTPTGLELLPFPIRRAMAATGRRMERGGTSSIQSALKPSRQLRNAPSPYRSENFLTERPGAPEGGLASIRGKERTLENITEFHDRIGAAQDALLDNVLQVDLTEAIANAARDVNEAISRGGDQALGLSVRDAEPIRREIENWMQAASEVSPNGVTNGHNARQFRGSLAHEARYNGPETTNARRVVAATIRERLNETLGQLSPEFRALDRQFAETIPLRNAVADALGRTGNNYPIGLRTSMILATGGASIPMDLGKALLVEGTSNFPLAVATAKAGRSLSGRAAAVAPFETLPIPALQAARATAMPENVVPFRMRNVAEGEDEQNLPPWARRPTDPISDLASRPSIVPRMP